MFGSDCVYSIEVTYRVLGGSDTFCKRWCWEFLGTVLVRSV